MRVVGDFVGELRETRGRDVGLLSLFLHSHRLTSLWLSGTIRETSLFLIAWYRLGTLLLCREVCTLEYPEYLEYGTGDGDDCMTTLSPCLSK